MGRLLASKDSSPTRRENGELRSAPGSGSGSALRASAEKRLQVREPLVVVGLAPPDDVERLRPVVEVGDLARCVQVVRALLVGEEVVPEPVHERGGAVAQL